MTPSETNDQRDTVVTAALAVMMRRGIGATTVQDVVSGAGISTGMFHYLVESMDAVLAEAFRRVARADLEATRTEISSYSAPIDRMRALLKAYSAGEDIGASQLWVDALAEAGRRPALRLATREYSLEWQRLLVELIDEGVASGDYAVEDPDGSSWRLLSAFDGLVLQHVAHGDVISRDDLDRWSRRGAEQELGLPPGTLAGE